MRFRKKVITDKTKEDSPDVKELLAFAKKIDVPQFSEDFWKIQYNTLYQEWENKKLYYRTKRILLKSVSFVFIIMISVFLTRLFIPVEIHNKQITYNSIFQLSQSSQLEIPDSHTLGIYYTEQQIFPLKDFVNYFNYVPTSMQKTIINDVFKSE